MRRLRELNRSRGAAAAVTGAIFLLMLTLNFLTPYICDDYTYRLNFLTRGPLGSVWEIVPSMAAHSYKMNGRLISHGLAQLFMLLPPVVFDAVNAAVFTLTLVLVLRLCCRERSALLLAAVFCMVWCLMPVFGQVALWQVGALNYFWSLSALVLFIAPALLQFLEDREILKRRWQRMAFCVYAFLFGWYSEIASFVGICMVLCLTALDALMNRRKPQAHRLVSVAFAIAGYAVMLSMPAQRVNKQAGGLTTELLMQRFSDCSEMLVRHLGPLLAIFAVLFLLGLLLRLPRKTLVTAALFALAGICANYMPLAATYYPERCLCCPVLMLLMASLFLAAPLGRGKGFAALAAVCCLILVLTLPAGLRGCRDIVSCHLQNAQREQTIFTALENGEGNVTANVVVPQTPWSGFWGVRDLTDDPTTWPNHAMALYYGLDSLVGE